MSEAQREILMETLQARAARLMESAEAASANGDYATAAAAAEEAADTYGALGQDAERADALVRVGGARFGLGEFESSVTAYRTASAIAEDSGLVDLQAFALWGEADGLARLGQWEDVEDTTRRGITLMRAYGHDTWLPGTQLLLGKALYFRDKEVEALALLEEARQGYRTRGAVADVSRVDDFTVEVLLFLEDYEQAAIVAARCLGASHALADPHAEAYAERRMGQVHLTAGDAAIAVDHFVRARAAYREQNWSASAATCDVWLARAYRNLERGEEAVVLYREAAATFDAAGWDSAHREALDELGASLLRQGRLKEAADVDSQLIQSWSTGPHNTDDGVWERIIIRHFDTLIRLEEHERAGLVLQLAAFDQTSADVRSFELDHPAYAFWVATTRAWVSWRTDDSLEGLQLALDLITRPIAPECDLASGIALEIAGLGAREPDKSVLLGRALAMLVRTGAWKYASDLADYIESDTAFPEAPSQLWLEFPARNEAA